jgi:hypothetical protein
MPLASHRRTEPTSLKRRGLTMLLHSRPEVMLCNGDILRPRG